MSAALITLLHIVHVSSALSLLGAVSYRCARHHESGRATLVWMGLSSVLLMITGMVMTRTLFHGMPGWVWAKAGSLAGIMTCWFLACRSRALVSLYLFLAFVFSVLAVAMVYLRPF